MQGVGGGAASGVVGIKALPEATPGRGGAPANPDPANDDSGRREPDGGVGGDVDKVVVDIQ
ncbi:MAG: hypothetical protein FWD11_02100, partial [Micrococcales bacterium]|nr:hypothetical protein [Micrococcales bacterium]